MPVHVTLELVFRRSYRGTDRGGGWWICKARFVVTVSLHMFQTGVDEFVLLLQDKVC